MTTFTRVDYIDGRCAETEVGQPWEKRWGIPDLEAGTCAPKEVGTLCIDKEDLKAKLKTFGGVEEHMPGVYLNAARREFRRNPAQFISDNPSVANKLLDLDKVETAAKQPTCVTITEKEAVKLSTGAVKSMMISRAFDTVPEQYRQVFWEQFRDYLSDWQPDDPLAG